MNEQASAESIFFAALERKSSKERLEYLDQACANNPQLRAQVERLLTAQANAGDFLDSSDLGTAQTGYQNESAQENALSATQAYSIVIEKPDVIVAGKYRLLEKLGEGGMGSVWAAEQREPVRRKVAIKLIKSGMDSKAVLARFEQERQALAVMDHPNIAKVFDGGVAQDGRPFFVMELVKGTPITEFCDARKLSPRERLELFVPV